MNKMFFCLVIALSLLTLFSYADESSFITLRNSNILDEQTSAFIPEPEASANRRPRDYPTQAPTTPHAIAGFTINKTVNQCLSCHDEKLAPLMKAPAVAVSHYQNRDGDYMANISPRRYFCNQCHLQQTDADKQVNNTFVKRQ